MIMSYLSSKHFSMERRQKTLKDFLTDDSNSCSSTGFKSFPRRLDRHHSSRSKAASATMISAFQALINSVKSIHFTAVKSPSNILPRSLSRMLSKRIEVKPTITTVKIKDIMRWKSFCDLMIEEKSQPSTDHGHDHDHDHTTTSTNTTSCSSSSSNTSSWCDSDFTSEFYLQSWSENDVELGKKYLPTFVGRDSMKTTTESQAISTVGPKDDLPCEEKDQCSPVSVLDDQFEEDLLSCFDQTLANVERTKKKFMQNIRCFESLAKIDPVNLDDDHEWMSMEDKDESNYDEEINEVEEKAKLLLIHVKATTSLMKNNCNYNLEQMLFDFFIEELSTKRNQIRDIEEVDYQIVKQARAWINGGDQQSETMELEACVREMDRKDRWGKFEEEEEEINIGLQMENVLLNHLLDELLVDLLL
ncbi:hypothetical protein Ddye_017929 [Dipteronia dyeriana]|uniref:DUF4378 domain-containing protein n=1 Tax=Dipteronia dyeriana TaxID=168575 RepID=A0AAD9UAK9_9ROSI|nr:hypothetical protein Ddye_017929 [Dipteronia dyeriana]